MARPGTPRLPTCLDQSYSCSKCDTQGLHLEKDVDPEDWCCRKCGDSVYIDMLDDGGHTYLVQRLPAKELQRGNYVLVETDYGHPRAYRAFKVLDAYRSPSRPTRWEVAIAEQPREKVDPDRYYNCSA